MTTYNNIVILTGAGISAESGLGTFRDKDGLWTKYDLNDVATPEGFQRDPVMVHQFYNARRKNLLSAKANDGHYALAQLERQSRGTVWVVTQNIDNLHEQAGTTNLIHMHGELLKSRCAACGYIDTKTQDTGTDTACPVCTETGVIRPHVVWFGEMPLYMDDIAERLALCDLFISIGTSGSVYPASGFVMEALRTGAHTVELNLEPSDGESLFAEKIYGPATKVVPAYVKKLLSA